MSTNITAQNILETVKMIEEEKLDIRTITMGISLLDCIDPDGDKAREKIYNSSKWKVFDLYGLCRSRIKTYYKFRK